MIQCPCGGGVVETSYHTKVCMECGLETFNGYSTANQVYNSHSSRPLPATYSRLSRFRDLIRRVFGLDNGPKVDDPVWNYLGKRSPFEDVAHIFVTLKQSPLQNKHYGSCHLFAICFSNYKGHPYSSQDLQFFVSILCNKFEQTLQRWNQCNQDSFFSYSWLIELYLRELKLYFFLQYVKHLQCPHRRKKYEIKLQALIDNAPQSSCARFVGRQNGQASHFPNVKFEEGNPHNLLCQDLDCPHGRELEIPAG